MYFNFTALIIKVNHLINAELVSALISKLKDTINGTCCGNHVNWDTGLCS